MAWQQTKVTNKVRGGWCGGSNSKNNQNNTLTNGSICSRQINYFGPKNTKDTLAVLAEYRARKDSYASTYSYASLYLHLVS